ncbi:9332_t:CDS:2 [Diversispora eburnea]|uniref:9332_t:CDS:1 n=1 Tax=Diversispora eburnea TaxID=1213867 RepID=A0A9N8WM42_9GLOM|nr:9332_t:CDS:2 [Diversispora eburnea]
MSKSWELLSQNYLNLLESAEGHDLIINVGIIEIENQDGVSILNLLTAADEIILPDFIEEVQKYLIENRSQWIQEQFYTVLDFAFSQTIYKSLQNFCLSLICSDPPLLFDSEYFYYTDINLLTALLQRDYPSEWNQELWNKFQKSLSPCIPYIRFSLMTPEQFREKVWPFKKLLSQERGMDELEMFKVTQKPMFGLSC